MADVLNSGEYLDETEENIEIVDLDGEPFEVIGDLEYEGEIYLALVRYKEEAEEAEETDGEFIVLRESQENGEDYLVTVDDNVLYDKIGGMFLEMFSSVAGED